MAIISSTVAQITQKGDRCRVREEHVDSAGNVYNIRYYVNHESEIDAVKFSKVAELNQNLISREQEEYLTNVLNGINLFQTKGDPVHSTRADTLNYILDYAFAETDPLKLLPGLPIFQMLTDTELMSLRGYTQIQVDEIRAKIASIESTLENYEPIGGGN